MLKALLISLSLNLFSQIVFAAEECVVHTAHESVSYVLIDRTEKLQDISKLQSFLEGVRESISPGERVLIATTSDSTSNTNVLLDLVNPKESIWESTMKVRAAQNKFKHCFTDLEKILGDKQEETKYSALLETINYFAKLIEDDSGLGQKSLFIY